MEILRSAPTSCLGVVSLFATFVRTNYISTVKQLVCSFTSSRLQFLLAVIQTLLLYKKRISHPDWLHQIMGAIQTSSSMIFFSPCGEQKLRLHRHCCLWSCRHLDSSYVSLGGQLHGLSALPEPERAWIFILNWLPSKPWLLRAEVYFSERLSEFGKYTDVQNR